jgi:hypothetical protein
VRRFHIVPQQHLSPSVRDVLQITDDAMRALEELELKIFDYATGSRVLIIDRPVNRSSTFDIQVCVVMWKCWTILLDDVTGV